MAAFSLGVAKVKACFRGKSMPDDAAKKEEPADEDGERDRGRDRRRDREGDRDRRRDRDRDRDRDRGDRDRRKRSRSRSRDRRSRRKHRSRSRDRSRTKRSNFSAGPPEGASAQNMAVAMMKFMPPVQTQQVDPSTKTMRELFVGNTPPGTQSAQLQVFLNQAMQQVRNCCLLTPLCAEQLCPGEAEHNSWRPDHSVSC